MARRGFLDYVMGGAVGGLEGLAQQRAAEDEKKRIADALARQVRMDAMTTADRAVEMDERSQDREQAQKDRLRSQRQSLLAGGYLPTGRDMPGATRRQPVSTETVDGQEFALYSTPRQLALQKLMEEAALKAKFNPDKMTPYQEGQAARDERRVKVLEKNSSRDQSDKAKSAGISSVIAGAGKIVAASRAEEKAAETQLAALDRIRPDPNRFQGTNEQFVAAEAAWQKRVNAAEKRLEAAQGKTARVAPTYENSLVSRDTTGYGEAYGPPAAPVAPARQPTYNTKEATLSAGAQRKINEIQSSDLTPEEKQEKVQQVNAILSREITKIRGQR